MTKKLLSILTAAVVTYLVRVLPLTLIRKPIRSRFLRSFLYYVPYVTLAVMTFPAIVQATEQPIAGAAALDRKSTRLNSSHVSESRMPSSA